MKPKPLVLLNHLTEPEHGGSGVGAEFEATPLQRINTAKRTSMRAHGAGGSGHEALGGSRCAAADGDESHVYKSQ